MIRRVIPGLAVLVLAVTPALGADPCAKVPAAARAYLNAHPGWNILRLADLDADDQSLWRQYRKGSCPGLAEVDLDGSGNKFVGLALIRKGATGTERIVVVRAGVASHTLYDNFVGRYSVIWRAAPGITWEWDDRKHKIHIPHDSLVVETIEAGAQQFYLKDGGYHYVQTSD